MEDPIIRIQNAEYIEFRDVTIEIGRYTLVDIDDGSCCILDGCILRNCGSHGVTISGGASHGVNNCEICETGNCGVNISGGDRLTLTSCNTFVNNSRIHHFSRWDWTYNPGVYCSGVGVRVSYNEFRDAPHTAILFKGNEHLFEYNNIHHVVQWSSDAGAIYGGRDWGQRGTVIRHNFIHHLKSAFPGYGQQGVYLDDCISGETVTGNVFYEIASAGIQSGGGRDNIMTNNVFAKCSCALMTDNRGYDRIVRDGSDWDLLKKIEDVNYQQAPWATAYPDLAAIPNSWATIQSEQHWLYPEGCVFSRNIGWQLDQWIEEDIRSGSLGTLVMYEDISNNIENQDPLFINEAGLDMTLQPTSPAYTIPGFEVIPFDKIGPQGK